MYNTFDELSAAFETSDDLQYSTGLLLLPPDIECLCIPFAKNPGNELVTEISTFAGENWLTILIPVQNKYYILIFPKQ